MLAAVLIHVPSAAFAASSSATVNVKSSGSGSASVNGVANGETKLRFDKEYDIMLSPTGEGEVKLTISTCGADILVQELYYNPDEPGQAPVNTGIWKNQGAVAAFRKFGDAEPPGGGDPPDPGGGEPGDPAYEVKYKIMLQRADMIDDEDSEEIQTGNGGNNGMETVYAPAAPRPVMDGGGCCGSSGLSAIPGVIHYSDYSEMSQSYPNLDEMSPVAYYEFPLGAVKQTGGHGLSPREKRLLSYGTLTLKVSLSSATSDLAGFFDYRPGPAELTPPIYDVNNSEVYFWNYYTVTKLRRVSDVELEITQYLTADFDSDPATATPRKSWAVARISDGPSDFIEFRHYNGAASGDPARVDRFSATASTNPLSLETNWEIDGKTIEKQFKQSLAYSPQTDGGVVRRVTARSEKFEITSASGTIPIAFEETEHEFYMYGSSGIFRSYMTSHIQGLGLSRRMRDYDYQINSSTDTFITEKEYAPDPGNGELTVAAGARAWRQTESIQLGPNQLEPWLSEELAASGTAKIRVSQNVSTSTFTRSLFISPPGQWWWYPGQDGETVLSRVTRPNNSIMVPAGSSGYASTGHDSVHGSHVSFLRDSEALFDVLGRSGTRLQVTDYHLIQGGFDGSTFRNGTEPQAPEQLMRGPLFRQIEARGLAHEYSLERNFPPPPGSESQYPASQGPFTIRHELRDLQVGTSSGGLSSKLTGKSTRVSTVSGKYGTLSEETFVWGGSAWEAMNLRQHTYWVDGQKKGKLHQIIQDGDIVETHDYPSANVEEITDSEGVVTVRSTLEDAMLEVETRVAAPALVDWEAQASMTISRLRVPKMDTSGSNLVIGFDEFTTTIADTLSQSESRSYDLGGELLSSTDVAGMVTTYQNGFLNNDAIHSESSATGTITRDSTHYMDGRLKSQGGSGQTKRTMNYEVRTSSGTMENLIIPAGILETETLWDDDTPAEVNRRVTTGDGELIWEHVNGVTTSYGYDDAGRLISRTTPSSDESQRVYIFERDYRGIVTKEGWDVDGDGQLLADSADVFTEHDQRYEKGADSAWWLVSVSTRYVLDGNATVQRATVRKVKQGTGATRISQVIHEDGAVETTTRTISGKVAIQTTTSTRHPDAAQTEVYYNGRLVSSQAFGQPQPVRYRYDALGRLTEVEDTSSIAVQTTLYDAAGRVQTVQSNAGTTSHGYYPANAATPNAGRLHWVEQPGGARVYYTYNARGQITGQWGPGAQPLRWIYDGLGQVRHLDTFLTQDAAVWAGPDMPALMASQELTENVSRRTFDVSQGRLASRTFGMGEEPTEYEYHPDGSVHHKLTGHIDGPATYAYDEAGRLSGIEYSPGQTLNVTLTHDRSGRVQTRTDSAGAHSFDYQADGTVVETVNGGLWDGLVLTRRVDEAGRLEEVEWSFAGVQRVIRYDYDSHSRLEQASFGLMNQPPQVSASYHWLPGTRRVERLERPITGSAQPLTGSFTHDEVGRLEKLEWRRGGTLYGSHEYGFDAAGRRQTETRQDGTTLHYAYTPRGELEHVERRRADGSLRPDWTHGYAYDDSGNRVDTSTPEGEHLIHEFEDASGLPYNASWGMTSRHEDPANAGFFKSWLRGRAHPQALVEVNGQAVEREGESWRYLYSSPFWDADTQLIVEASRPDLASPPPPVRVKHVPTYNGIGFRIDRQGNMQSHGRGHLSFDENGNRVGYGTGWQLVWNAENRLRLMYDIETRPQPDGSTPSIRHEIYFTYDGLGRRIGKRARGYWMTSGNYGNWLYDEETLFLWDGWTLLAEFVRTEENGPWHLRRGYLWGLDLSGSLEGAGGVGGLLWVVEHTPGRAESHRQLAPWYDGNGNVMGWVENEAAYTLPLWRLEYDPYGRLLVEDPVRVVRHHKHRTLGIEEKWLHRPPSGFSTKYEDAETGLLYYGFRYYSPDLGRWINRDPIGEDGGFNLYGMVGNDAVNRVDYLGLATCSRNLGLIAHLNEQIKSNQRAANNLAKRLKNG